ncbi:MAG: type I 3-dehydroquinate dehydratase [Bacteroides sp.]|nr:type I 3-dehydroquinate dehydratase [Bacteroides sp.]
MICTTIQNRNLQQVLDALDSCEMAEIRLDRCEMSMEDISECFTSDVPLVATCRITDVMAIEPSLQDDSLTPQSREIKAMQIAEKRLCRAIEAGARYVDVEIEAPKQMSKRVRNVAHENGTVFMRSYHDFSGTGSVGELREIVEKCRYHGADLVKIVTTALSQEDVERVMSLYEWDRNVHGDGGLIAFCMGDAGRQSRLDCLRHGSPFTYAAMESGEEAAPGQWPYREMACAVYGGFPFIASSGAQDGTHDCQEKTELRMPASKSFAQRAIIAAALADGVSHLGGYTPCSDSEAAIAVARTIGAEVAVNACADGTSLLEIKGVAAAPGTVDIDRLDVCESGLMTRMMIPLSAQIASSDVTITGEKTLLNRPMKGAREMLACFGVQLESCASADSAEDGTCAKGAGTDCKVPLKVCGMLSGGKAEISGKNGSQLISGLLMALPLGDRNSTVSVTEPKSIPYMFITLDVLKHFGIKVQNEMSGGRDFFESDGDWSLCTEMTFRVKAGQRYRAADFELEGDWSAAANFLVAGAIFGKAEIHGLDTTSLQADLSIMDILMDAGASLSQIDGDKGAVTVQRAPLSAFSVDASNCPDLFPIVSVLAAFCQGTSRIGGVDRLAHKESDRGQAIADMLTAMGVSVRIEGNELCVEGQSLAQRLLCGNLLKGGSYASLHDHRMVMALKVAELGADRPIEIDDEACVAKSFPGFMEKFAELLA